MQAPEPAQPRGHLPGFSRDPRGGVRQSGQPGMRRQLGLNAIAHILGQPPNGGDLQLHRLIQPRRGPRVASLATPRRKPR